MPAALPPHYFRRLLHTAGAGVCGSSAQRQQQLQALLAAYPHGQQDSSRRSKEAQAAGQEQQQQQVSPPPQEFPADSPELALYRWVLRLWQQQPAVSGSCSTLRISVSKQSSISHKSRLCVDTGYRHVRDGSRAWVLGVLCAVLLVCRWALEQGATSQVTPALFQPTPTTTSSSSEAAEGSSTPGAAPSPSSGLRGCAAAGELEAGSVVMSVPAKLLITYQTAAESDFGKALSRLPGEPHVARWLYQLT